MRLSDPSPAEKYFDRHLLWDSAGRGWLDYRIAPGGTAEMVNIEVAAEHRREGIGRTLLALMIAELPPNVHTVYAFTSATNEMAHDWYKAMSFTLIKVPGFYASMGEDAYLCVKNVR